MLTKHGAPGLVDDVQAHTASTAQAPKQHQGGVLRIGCKRRPWQTVTDYTRTVWKCQLKNSVQSKGLTSHPHLGGIFCCRSLWKVICKDMPQVALHALSSGRLCMDLQSKRQVASVLQYKLGLLHGSDSTAGVTSDSLSGGPLNSTYNSLMLSFTKSTFQSLIILISNVTRQRLVGQQGKDVLKHLNMGVLQFHYVHLSALAGRRHAAPVSRIGGEEAAASTSGKGNQTQQQSRYRRSS